MAKIILISTAKKNGLIPIEKDLRALSESISTGDEEEILKLS